MEEGKFNLLTVITSESELLNYLKDGVVNNKARGVDINNTEGVKKGIIEIVFSPSIKDLQRVREYFPIALESPMNLFHFFKMQFDNCSVISYLTSRRIEPKLVLTQKVLFHFFGEDYSFLGNTSLMLRTTITTWLASSYWELETSKYSGANGKIKVCFVSNFLPEQTIHKTIEVILTSQTDTNRKNNPLMVHNTLDRLPNVIAVQYKGNKVQGLTSNNMSFSIEPIRNEDNKYNIKYHRKSKIINLQDIPVYSYIVEQENNSKILEELEKRR